MTSDTGFFAQALATAIDALGLETFSAISGTGAGCSVGNGLKLPPNPILKRGCLNIQWKIFEKDQIIPRAHRH